MDQKLYEAAKTIHEYCKSSNGCTGCPFDVEHGEDGYIGCFEATPEDWFIKNHKQEA